MKNFLMCFVPLFVAVDAIGVLPIFVSFTDKIECTKKSKVIFQSIITASIVALFFLWFGPVLLRFLDISISDFMIAGGVLLLAISLSDLITGQKKQRQTDKDCLGAVPIGIPLITGPAVLTTCILLVDIYGRLITSLAIIINIIIAGLVFSCAQPITSVLGKSGTKTVSKLASILLASIAIKLIRKGISSIIMNL